MSVLDILFPSKPKGFEDLRVSEKGRVMNFGKLKTITNAFIFGGLAVIGGAVYMFGAMEPGDMHTLLSSSDGKRVFGDKSVDYFEDWKRYCEPNVKQRWGNGFDSKTCRDKWDQMIDYAASQKLRLEYQREVDPEMSANADKVRRTHGRMGE